MTSAFEQVKRDVLDNLYKELYKYIYIFLYRISSVETSFDRRKFLQGLVYFHIINVFIHSPTLRHFHVFYLTETVANTIIYSIQRKINSKNLLCLLSMSYGQWRLSKKKLTETKLRT